MLNMSSASPPDADRTGRARIRDAAIARFAADGVAKTSLKAIAEDAGVSPPLVVHHFKSKAGLRVACDEYVAATIREEKRKVLTQGGPFDPFGQAEGFLPLIRYLARTLADGSPEATALLDEMVEDAVAYMDEGVRAGMIKPSEHHRGRAVVLTLWSLGALMLHEHMERLLGAPLTADAKGLAAYMVPASEILANGLLTEDFAERLKDALPQKKDDRS